MYRVMAAATLAATATATMAEAATSSARFIDYPAFVRPGARIEAVIDRGLVAELIVRCQGGAAIVSYSKVERLYCTPGNGCTRDRQAAIARSCR